MFYEVLKNLRISQGLSQEELSKIVGVSKSTIGMYEQGKRMPKADETLTKLAEYFSVTVDYLLGLSPDRFPAPNIADNCVTPPTIGDIATKHKCSSTEDCGVIATLYTQLDIEDRAEIKGEIKQMLKAEKYTKQDNINVAAKKTPVRTKVKKQPKIT